MRFLITTVFLWCVSCAGLAAPASALQLGPLTSKLTVPAEATVGKEASAQLELQTTYDDAAFGFEAVILDDGQPCPERMLPSARNLGSGGIRGVSSRSVTLVIPGDLTVGPHMLCVYYNGSGYGDMLWMSREGRSRKGGELQTGGPGSGTSTRAS